MNFLFFGGWVCSAVSLILAAVILVMFWMDCGGYKFKPSTRDAVAFGIGVWGIASVLASLCIFIVGSIALYKGWFW